MTSTNSYPKTYFCITIRISISYNLSIVGTNVQDSVNDNEMHALYGTLRYADKYPSIFPRQMATFVHILLHI